MTKNYSQCILLFGFEDFSENNLGLEKKNYIAIFNIMICSGVSPNKSQNDRWHNINIWYPDILTHNHDVKGILHPHASDFYFFFLYMYAYIYILYIYIYIYILTNHISI